MKVLLAHSRYRYPGGEERHVELLANMLSSAGHSVRRLEPMTPSYMTLIEKVALGATLVYRPRSGRLLRDFVRAEAPDIVHFHNITPSLTPAALRAAKISGASVVMTLHNYRFACPAGTLLRGGVRHEDCLTGSSLACGLRNPRGNWIESVVYGVAIELQRRLRLLTRWVDAFVVPASHLRDAFIRAGGPADRTHVIANGVPLSEHPRELGGYALYAGRLSEEKGIVTLLHAAELAPSIPLVVAGDGPLENLFARTASNVVFRGRLSPEELADVRRGSAFVVVPSECDEILPFAATEALADGKPIIATPNGGLTDVVIDGVTGVLVPERSPRELAEAMTRLWRDEALRGRMQSAARAHAERHFDLRTQTGLVIELYEHLLTQDGNGSSA